VIGFGLPNQKRKKEKKERKKGKKKGKTKNTQQNMSLIRTVIVKVTIPMPTSTTNIQIHHFTTAFMCPMSIAGMPFDSVGSLRTTLLLRSTCMRSCCKWSATIQTKNKTKSGWTYHNAP